MWLGLFVVTRCECGQELRFGFHLPKFCGCTSGASLLTRANQRVPVFKSAGGAEKCRDSDCQREPAVIETLFAADSVAFRRARSTMTFGVQRKPRPKQHPPTSRPPRLCQLLMVGTSGRHQEDSVRDECLWVRRMGRPRQATKGTAAGLLPTSPRTTHPTRMSTVSHNPFSTCRARCICHPSNRQMYAGLTAQFLLIFDNSPRPPTGLPCQRRRV